MSLAGAPARGLAVRYWPPMLALLAALAAAAAPVFVDATREAGLDFAYRPGRTPQLHLPEIMGGGAALFDFDGDGDLDLYLVQGGQLGSDGRPLPARETDRLFRNDPATGPDGRRRPRFSDISAAAGLAPGGYGMGVAAGDYDGDGWTDLVVTGFGRLRLLRNVAGRRLEEAGVAAGVSDDGLSVSAAFLDVDRDGRLDLYVARYVDYTPVRCVLASGRPDYCGPKSFKPQRDRVFRNLGGGRFEDAGARWLGPHRTGAGLGAVTADVDGDGFTDLYVANDGSDNHLWMNRAGRALEDDGLLAGVALNRMGQAEAGMGTDAGDADGDGDPDLFVANLTAETNTYYVNQGGGLFEDRTIGAGLAGPSLAFTGFGTRFLDYDNDGALDLVVVNGAVHLPDQPVVAGQPLPLDQPKLLFRNLGGGRFEDASALAGPAFARPENSRGLAVGDLDDDGDPDLVAVDNDQPARVLLDAVGQDQPWLGLRLVEADGRRDAPGAVATLRRRGAPDLVRHVHTDGSYASASDPRLLFGLGQGRDLAAVEVRWPDGTRERFDPPGTGRYTTLRHGQGTPLQPAAQP